METQSKKGTTASPKGSMNTSNTAAIYLRRSAIDGSGEDISLTYQQEACERIAESNGLEIVHIFNEGDGQSASNFKTNERPEFEGVLVGLGGSYKNLIAWSVDRLSRKGMRDVGRMLDLAEEQGGRIITNDGLDTAQSSGRMIAALKSEMARDEVEKTSTRVREAKNQKRKKGSHLGGVPPYGFKAIRHVDAPTEIVVDQEQAKVVQMMVDRYLAGASFMNVANWLNEQGISGSGGDHSRWSHKTVNGVLSNVALIGYRRYKTRTDQTPELYCDENGEPVKVLEPIISDAEFYRIQKMKGNRKTPTGKQSVTYGNTSTLLGGFLKCAITGQSLIGARRERKDPTTPLLKYFCTCGEHEDRNSVWGEDVEPHVVGLALMYVSRLLKEAKDNEGEPSPILDEVAKRMTAQFTTEQLGRREELEGQLLDLEYRKSKLFDDYYRDGKIDDENFNRIESQLSMKMDTVTAELRTLPKAQSDFSMFEDLVSAGDDLVGPGSAWDQLEIHVQKMILLCLLDEVVITYVPRGGKGPAPEEWRDMSPRVQIEFATADNVVKLSTRNMDRGGRMQEKPKKASA